MWNRVPPESADSEHPASLRATMAVGADKDCLGRLAVASVMPAAMQVELATSGSGRALSSPDTLGGRLPRVEAGVHRPTTPAAAGSG